MGDKRLVQENYPGRGWLSSGLPEMWFGLEGPVDSVRIGNEVISNEVIGAELKGRIKVELSHVTHGKEEDVVTMGEMIEAPFNLDFVHKEDKPRDMTREPLMPHVLSTQGPAVAISQKNYGMHRDGIFLGGGRGQKGKVFLVDSSIEKAKVVPPLFIDLHTKHEDTDAVFF